MASTPSRDIQVFAPVYRGELGIDALNEALRDALNPDGEPIRGGRLRLGDKLMMTGRNLHDLGLMNGTLLRLLDEVPGSDGDDPALILGAEDTIFRLPPEESDRLRLAYACSVHRGQGIELPVAVIVAHQAAGAFFLRREMLYTAVTRARLATVIVGTRDVLARAARTPDTGRRHSRLAQRLSVESAATRTDTVSATWTPRRFELPQPTAQRRPISCPRPGCCAARWRTTAISCSTPVAVSRRTRAAGATMGIPLLYPWANRLESFGYEAAGKTVSFPDDRALTDADPNGLPIHGAIPG